MGSKVENVGRKVEQASEMEHRGIEQGERDASEVGEIKSIIEGMDRNVDEDIVQAMEVTREAAKNEGASHMNAETHAMLEEGYHVADETIHEATEQSEKSRQSAEQFRSMKDITEFGSGAAESSASNSENIAEQFDSHAERAQSEIQESEDRFQQLLDDILG